MVGCVPLGHGIPRRPVPGPRRLAWKLSFTAGAGGLRGRPQDRGARTRRPAFTAGAGGLRGRPHDRGARGPVLGYLGGCGGVVQAYLPPIQ